jgi:hypothetical protein
MDSPQIQNNLRVLVNFLLVVMLSASARKYQDYQAAYQQIEDDLGLVRNSLLVVMLFPSTRKH